MEDRFEAIRLQLKNYYRGNITPEEEMELMATLKTLPNGVLKELLASLWDEEKGDDVFYTPRESDHVFADIMAQVKSPRRLLWGRVAAVLAFVFLGSVSYWYLNKSAEPSVQSQAIAEKDVTSVIHPGEDKAVFVSSNGEVLNLQDLQVGASLNQDGAELKKEDDGTIVYRMAAFDKTAQQVKSWPTLRTPKGGQCPFRLPDGSQVWLNANSSISFAPDFPQGLRQVKVKGEVYFEVAKDAHAPFEVLVAETRIQVLGTRFNVSAYADDAALVTTLLDGIIKVQHQTDERLLKPGQQASLSASRELVVQNAADPNAAIAWKNGFFQFNDSDIASIMRQVARWYDVSVKYEGNIPSKKLTGSIPRHATLKQMLDVLAYSGVHFSVHGREITVKGSS
ncbi:FecR domain-containing protein [Olivibacter domesticus]|uniref:FecR family protein n=1 Tax=Olivibacter domesticus TaxID=407022 RepID=A0A1H7ZFJ8_OLID1|nr:FecR domain-containing protein [Olivibacter domesticus]SEM56754.1 FecR family protein [Olivibacter domesticus]